MKQLHAFLQDSRKEEENIFVVFSVETVAMIAILTLFVGIACLAHLYESARFSHIVTS